MDENMAGFGARRFAEKNLRKQEEMRRYEEEQRRYQEERILWEQEQERLRWEQEQEQLQQQQWQQQQDDWNYQNSNGNENGNGDGNGNDQDYNDWNGNGNDNYHDEYRDNSDGQRMMDQGQSQPDQWNGSNGISMGIPNDGYDDYQNSNHHQGQIDDGRDEYPSHNSHSHQDQYDSSPNPHFDQAQDYNDPSLHDKQLNNQYSHQSNQYQEGDPYNEDPYGASNGHSNNNNHQNYSSSDEDPYASNDWEGNPARIDDFQNDSNQNQNSKPQLNRPIPERSPTIDSSGSSARLAYGTSSSDEADSYENRRNYSQQESLEEEEVFRPPGHLSIGNSTIREGDKRFTNTTLTARSNTTPRGSNYGARDTFYDDGDEYEEEAWTGGNSSRYTRYEGNDDGRNQDSDSDDYLQNHHSSSSSSNENHKRKSESSKLNNLLVPNGSSRISSQPRLRERASLANGSSGGGRGAATTSMYAPAPQAKCADCGLEIPFEDLADHQCTNLPLRSPTNLTPLESPTDLRSLSPSSGGSASPSFFDKYQTNILKDGRSNSPAFAPPSRSNSEDQTGSKSPTPSVDPATEERRRQIEQQRAAKKGGAAIAATAVMASLRLAKAANNSTSTAAAAASSSISKTTKTSTSSSSFASSSPTSYKPSSHKKQYSFSSAESNTSSLLETNGGKRKLEITPSTSFDESISSTSPKERNSPAFKGKESSSSSRSKDKPSVNTSDSKSKSGSRSNSDSKEEKKSNYDENKLNPGSKKSKTRDRSKRFDSRSDQVESESESDLTPAQSPNFSTTFSKPSIQSKSSSSSSSTSNSSTSASASIRNKPISSNLLKSKKSNDKKIDKEEVDIGEIENLVNSLTTSSPKKMNKEREREKDSFSKSKNLNSSSPRSRKTSETDSPRKKEREREREISHKESSRNNKSSVRSPTKSSKPQLSIHPSTSLGLSMREKERRRAERKHRKCAICQCSLASSKTLCVEQDGKLLCAKDWAELYLPKCRKCREPVERNAVKSADGALKGIFHRHCLCCFECDVAFDDGEFYIFENTPYCAEHYHIRNGSLCAACGNGIEGHCRQTESGERFHPRCLRCEYETGNEFCQESLEIFWELDGQKLCERHMEKTRKRLEKKGRKNVNASKRRTMLKEIKA